MNRFVAIVAMISFAAFGDGPSPVTKTRLGSLHPREGLVVTDIDLSAIGGVIDTNAVNDLITSATNGLATAEDVNSKADKSALDNHEGNTKNPHKVTAAQVGALPIIGGTLTGDLAVGEAFAGSRTLSIASDNGAAGITLQGGTSDGNGSILTIGGSSGSGATLYVNGGAMRGGHVIVGASTGGGGILEVQGSDASIKKDGKEVATEAYVDDKVRKAVLPTDPTFSNAVLAVGLNIDTNSVAVLNEIASTFGGFPIEGTATTVGGLLAALAAAVAWMKRNKADKTEVDEIKSTVSTDNRFLVDGTTAAIQTRESETAEWVDEIRVDKGYDALTGDVMVKLDKSVQTVTVVGSNLYIEIPDSVGGTVRDLCVYANNSSSADTALTFPAGTYYGDDPNGAVAKAGKVTAIYLTEIPKGAWMLRITELDQHEVTA